MDIPKLNKSKTKKKAWHKLLEIIPANIIYDTWKNKLWICKKDNKIISKESMIHLLSNPKDIHIWLWWKKYLRTLLRLRVRLRWIVTQQLQVSRTFCLSLNHLDLVLVAFIVLNLHTS